MRKLLLLTLLLAPTLHAQSPDRVILVLPFDNGSGQTSLNWIGDSFPDTLNARLSSAGFLTISQTDREFALDHLGLPTNFRPTRATTLRIAENLDANYVVVGSYNLQDTAGTKRITVQAQILSVAKLRLSSPLQDSADLPRLFDIENAVAWKIARQIDPQFSVAQQTFLAASAGIRLSSFENYIRGLDETSPPQRVKFLQAAVTESPTYADALLALGRQQYADRDYDKAAITLAKVPQANRLALEANFFRGLARFNEAKYSDAEAAFSFVAARLPLPEVVNNQGVALARQGRDGSPFFQRAASADPNDPDYHFNAAVALFRRADFPGARREDDTALKLRPADTEAAELRNAINAGRKPSAADPFQPTERIRRTWSESGFRQAAFQLDQVRAMRLATLPPPQQAIEYTQLGRDYLNQGLLPEAEQEFQTAIQADPGNPAAHTGLAEVRADSGSPAEARSEAQTSITLKPNAPAYLILARLDLQANQLPASASDVSNALRLEPNNTAAQGFRQALAARGQTLP